jgi:hypothetical protein
MTGLLLEEIEEILVARKETKHGSSSPGPPRMSTARGFDRARSCG